ncbi:hypothetical protein AVEN_244736-1 [Araneus ventricosus]|uniref:Uncharacterized protein n=1 Tax=Araneus ventricosus TaxID=182803 RepID=A0A4Y2BRB0_ARAVE|nr:hypothetical protein AVEN_244736-1 [Araneus ventricosus]
MLSSSEWPPQMGLGKRDVLRIRTVPAVVMVYEGVGEFPLSLKEELRSSRILRLLYSNRLRNQSVKKETFSGLWIETLDAIAWPPSSQDFSPSDAFACGFIKPLCINKNK